MSEVTVVLFYNKCVLSENHDDFNRIIHLCFLIPLIEEVLQGVAAGIDLFESTYVTKLSTFS